MDMKYKYVQVKFYNENSLLEYASPVYRYARGMKYCQFYKDNENIWIDSYWPPKDLNKSGKHMNTHNNSGYRICKPLTDIEAFAILL